MPDNDSLISKSERKLKLNAQKSTLKKSTSTAKFSNYFCLELCAGKSFLNVFIRVHDSILYKLLVGQEPMSESGKDLLDHRGF